MQNEKILNNNVVQALDNNVEYIVMGKGLGFQKKVGDLVDKEKIEKTFVLENTEAVEEWSRVYVNLPDGEMQVFLNILTFAEAVLQTKFDPSFFIALADHLHYAIERSREGVSLQNPLAWEVLTDCMMNSRKALLSMLSIRKATAMTSSRQVQSFVPCL